MPKYAPEKKEAAMTRMAEVGVAKTSEELGISVPTLYKWRNETGDKADSSALSQEALQEVLGSDPYLEKKLRQVEAENAALREENLELRQRLAKMKTAMISLIG